MTDVVREALEAAADFIQREADLRDASAFAETDPYIAEPRALCIKLAAALSALGEKDDGWLPIESAPTLARSLSSRVEEAKRRAEAAETRSAKLARALNELIIAADSLATTANLSQADREIDRALSALAGHDAAIRAGGDDA